MSRAASAALLVAAAAGAWALLHVGWLGRDQITDYAVYEKYGNLIRHGFVPYRHFQVEYPPAALIPMTLPSWFGGHFRSVFQGEMFACLLALVFAVWRLAGRRAALATAIAPLLLGSIVLSRFDLWPTALLALGLAALVSDRFTLGGILVGTAFAAKLWPAVVVPFVLVWLVRTRGRDAAVRFGLVAGVVALLWFAPFFAAARRAVLYPFHAQFARPLQVESLGATVLMALHNGFGLAVHVTNTYGSQNLAGTGVRAATVLTSAFEVVALVAVFILFLRSRAEDSQLLLSCAAAVAALIAFGKVFSPQFLIWLFPFAWIASGRRGALAAATAAAAFLLTLAYFPHRYWDFVNGFARPGVAIVLTRDVLCVALVVLYAWPRRLEDEALGEHRARIEALERVRAQVE